MELIPFSLNDEIVTVSGNVESNCQGITFVNIGASSCTILSITLAQGQSFTPAINIGEIDKTNYTVRFDNLVSDKRLVVIRKSYSV